SEDTASVAIIRGHLIKSGSFGSAGRNGSAAGRGQRGRAYGTTPLPRGSRFSRRHLRLGLTRDCETDPARLARYLAEHAGGSDSEAAEVQTRNRALAATRERS